MGAFYDHYSADIGASGGLASPPSGPQLTLVERRSLQGHNTSALVLPPRALFTESWTIRNPSSKSQWFLCVLTPYLGLH